MGRASLSSAITRTEDESRIRPEALRADMRFLADDLLECRATETRGHDIAAKFMASEFEGIGLEPAGSCARTNAKVVTDSLDLQGAPTWATDGHSITTAAEDHSVPHLYRVPVDGHPPTSFLKEYSVDPAWAPDGSFVVYSGPDIGTTFSVKAATAQAAPHPIPGMSLTRGTRHFAFLDGGRALVLLRGEIQHKNLWLVNLVNGSERQLTNFSPDFDVRDFDISPDGREVVFERVQERSDVVLLDLPRS